MQTPTHESFLRFSHEEVSSLLRSYARYNELSLQIQSGGSSKPEAKFSLMGNFGKMQNLDPLAEAKRELQSVADSMKFQNPFIWIEYKRLAYKDEPEKALKVLTDLVGHCKVDGICSKRFSFINKYFREKNNGLDLTSFGFLNQMTDLEQVGQDPRYISMCLDQDFERAWSKNENDPEGKWKNYSPD